MSGACDPFGKLFCCIESVFLDKSRKKSVDELSAADRTLYERARKLQNFLTQPFYVAEPYTGKPGEYVSLAQSLDGCERIIMGKVDHRPEEEFYLIGALT